MELLARLLGSPSTDSTTVIANFLSVIARLVGSDAMLVLIGGTIFLSFIRIPYSASRKGRWLDQRAHRWLWGTWAAALIGEASVFFLRGPATRGVAWGDMLAEPVLAETLNSRFGMAYFARTAILLLGVAPLLLLGWPWAGGKGRLAARRRPGWLLAAALIMTAPMSGHSGAGAWPVFGVIVGFTHFASATVWGGGLLLMFACYLPRVDTRLRAYLPQFSRVAVIAFIIAAFSGTVQAWRQLGSTGVLSSWEAMTSTTYGWLTIAKLAAFAVLVAIAGGSRHLSESVGAEGPADPGNEGRNSARIRHLIQVEFVVAFFVFFFTAMMTNVAPGYEEVAERTAQAAQQQQQGGQQQGQQAQQGQQGQQDGQDQGTQGGALQLAAAGNSWDPLELQLTAGADVAVQVANTDGVLHSFTFEEAGVDQDVEGGQRATVQFTAPDAGTYTFVCKYHSGMEGEVTVS